MTTFVYKAKHGPDRTVEGELTAESHSAALARLDAMGYIPLKVEARAGTRGSASRLHKGRVRYHDVTVLTRQLASLTRAGVPILRALATIAGQTENARLQQVMDSVQAVVRDGSPLSTALGRHKDLFPELYISLTRAGESAGKLDTVLFSLAEAREQEEEIRRKVQAAMAYPALVLVVGLVTVFVLLSFFLPQVVDLYRDFRKLPLPTRILIGMSDFMAAAWHWILMVLVLVVVVVRRLAVLEKGKSFFSILALKIPFFNRFVLDTEIARFARTLALLLESGVPIDRALALGRDTFRNAVLREEITKIREQTVQQGIPFSEGLKRSLLFPPLVGNMTAVGEEGGHMESALVEVALFCEKNVEQRGRIAVSLLEPILILGVGLVVGFIVAAMLLPIFELGTGL